MRIMYRKTLIITTLVALCILSCRENSRRKDAAKIVREWTGKEIKFPKGLFCISMGKDTTCVDLYTDNFKILLYVDSLGCTSCRLKLYEWKKLMQESDSIFVRKPEFAFIFQPKRRDGKEVEQILKNNGFSHPVFIDKENETDRINKFPANSEYQCFLLDKDNKVIFVGNPSLNTGIWTLFKRIITERETGVLTMKKGGEFTSFAMKTTLPPQFHLKERRSQKY